MKWLKFFFGSPRRAIATTFMVGAMALLEQVAPGTLGGALYALASVLITTLVRILVEYGAPVFFALLPVIIVLYGFKVIIKGWR